MLTALLARLVDNVADGALIMCFGNEDPVGWTLHKHPLCNAVPTHLGSLHQTHCITCYLTYLLFNTCFPKRCSMRLVFFLLSWFRELDKQLSHIKSNCILLYVNRLQCSCWLSKEEQKGSSSPDRPCADKYLALLWKTFQVTLC